MKKDVLYMPGMMAVCAILIIAVVVLLMLRLPAEAANDRCVRLSRVQGFETLVNTCDSCRNAQIIRDRSGLDLPTMRSFRIDSRKTQDLFFKGQGRTRITSDEPCNLEAGIDQAEKRKAQESSRKCVSPVQTDRGIVMVNGCTTCRKVIVERRFAEGGKNFTPYVFDAKGVMALASDGALQAVIIDDKPCNI
ncbi:MAG: hypothetical protein HON65_16470 [Rhodospirillales bacterium]|jgi:hypothetical protein|nr:hypothetical protein [Rhodospirillales bacterium]